MHGSRPVPRQGLRLFMHVTPPTGRRPSTGASFWRRPRRGCARARCRAPGGPSRAGWRARCTRSGGRTWRHLPRQRRLAAVPGGERGSSGASGRGRVGSSLRPPWGRCWPGWPPATSYTSRGDWSLLCFALFAAACSFLCGCLPARSSVCLCMSCYEGTVRFVRVGWGRYTHSVAWLLDSCKIAVPSSTPIHFAGPLLFILATCRV